LAFLSFSFFNKAYFSETFNFDFSNSIDYTSHAVTYMDLATPKISVILFWIICIVLSVFTFIKNYSLIPLMGVSTCLYLLTGMSKSNWVWFFAWLAIGLIFYFLYSFKNSKLAIK
jgi:hypothetical protein